ncbi:MAG TPA: ZIP family metal transporter [Gaiellaceae bacterium]|nr:ZIP family metal transporter [Gaiellaceae bacterium]
MDIIVLLLAATGTALATGLGAIPVFFLGARAERLRPLLWGGTVGMMTVASVVGLLRPALEEGDTLEVAAGLVAGVAFLVASRRFVDRPRFEGLRGRGLRLSFLVFAVLFIHSLPEGFAIGTAYASDRSGLSLFVIVAIALHNIPEGTTIAVPMSVAGFSRAQQFWAAVATSAPQPPGALAAYLVVEHFEALLPASFAFAAGAMLALVAIELVPVAFAQPWRTRGISGALAGGALMLVLAVLLQP